MLMFSWEYLVFRMNNTSLTVLLSFFHDIKLTFEISVFCTCSWIWSLTCWEHHHWKRWGQLVKAPRHTYSGVLINRYCWRLLAFLALGLDYPSQCRISSVQDAIAALSLCFTSWLYSQAGEEKKVVGMACMFVNTWFGSLIWELSLPVNWIKFSKGGCVVAVALLNSVLFKLQFRQKNFFPLVKCISGFCLVRIAWLADTSDHLPIFWRGSVFVAFSNEDVKCKW